jgi:uncharacterized protein YndB with AHSA1/START domain
MGAMTQSRSDTVAIVVEKLLPHPPEKIWRALTQSELIAQWLMPNDFAPRVGHRFQFKTKPMGDWDGVVHCEVLACEPLRLLRYSWQGGSAANPGCGSLLDSVVTWTLTAREDGTHVRMEHDGFHVPANQSAYDAMSPGWARVLDGLERVTRENL